MLRSWAGQDPAPEPVMFRVSDCEGNAPSVIRVETVWLPSGRRVHETRHTADGLCIVPWRGESERVEIRLQRNQQVASIKVSRRRKDAGRVHEVRLKKAG